MRLLTLNVHGWLEEKTEEKIAALAQVIAERDYDVVALQEVNQSLSSPLVTSALREDNYGLVLVEHLQSLGREDYSYFWTPSHIGYGRFEEGSALLTKLPVYEVDTFYCSRNQSFDTHLSRKILGLTVSYKGQRVQVYSCHINLPNETEEDQLDNVRKIVNSNPAETCKILLGDFNIDAFSDQKTYQAVLNLGLVDSYSLAVEKDSGVTVEKAIDGWEGQSSQKRLDYVFLNQEWSVRSSRVVCNGQKFPIVSDHFGVEVLLEGEERRH